MALRLSKEGYGTPKEILDMPTDLVMATWEYADFRAHYEEAFMFLNRKEE